RQGKDRAPLSPALAVVAHFAPVLEVAGSVEDAPIVASQSKLGVRAQRRLPLMERPLVNHLGQVGDARAVGSPQFFVDLRTWVDALNVPGAFGMHFEVDTSEV